MANAGHSAVNPNAEEIWPQNESVTDLPLYEIVAKFRLPVLAKAIYTSGENDDPIDGIVDKEVYRLKRLVQMQVVIAQALPGDTGIDRVDISIPKDYRAPFKVSCRPMNNNNPNRPRA